MCVSTSSTSSTTISAIPSTVPRRCCERWSRRGAWAARPVAASMSIAIEAAGLSETQRQIVDLAREFARTRIEPHAAEWDRTAHFARDVLDELGKLGFLGMSTPEEYDGMGLDTLTYLLALEELAAADASVAVSVSIHNAIPATMLLRHGDSRQKERWLKPMARGELLAGFALSEPESGSDAASLSARALRAGDQWVLSGTKAWATNGGTADVMMIMVRTDRPDARRGATRVEAARALAHAAAARRDRGESITSQASMAKLFASETAMWVTTQAVQLFGGYGYMRDFPVEKLFRDAKVTEIYEGTSEIQRIIVARGLYPRA